MGYQFPNNPELQKLFDDEVERTKGMTTEELAEDTRRFASEIRALGRNTMLKTSVPNGNNDTALRGHLYECYNGFADKRIKDLAKERRFFVDDRENGGLSSDGLYGWFCGIVVDVESDKEILVTMHGDIPDSPSVQESFNSLEAFEKWANLCFIISQEKLPRLRTLASRVREITAPGNRYNVPSYKYMCPRTADSLEHLADHLEVFWNGRDGE